MDPVLTEQIIKDSAELLCKTAELESEVATLSKSAQLARQELEQLKTAASQQQDRVKAAAANWSARLVERGLLKEEKVAQFLSSIESDPAQIIEVAEKVASQSSAEQLGSGDPAQSSDVGLDPLAKWACGR